MRSTKLAVLLVCMGLLLAFAAACGTAATPEAPAAVPPTPTPLQLPKAAPPTQAPAAAAPTSTPCACGPVSGASLFTMACSSCHGQDAAGLSFNMDNNKIDTPSLAWSELSQTYAADPSRGDVKQQVALSITKGLDETGGDLNAMMPHWSDLSQAQVDSLVNYLENPIGGGPSNLSPAALNLMGEPLFQTSCAACHGADGKGKTFDVDGQTITTPSLSWGDLTQMYASDPSRGDVPTQLGLAITKGEDEAGDQMNEMMPRWSLLSQPQVDSLVQYIQATFK